MDWFQIGNGVHQGTAAHQAFLEELMLKLQYFGHLMRRADSLEKTLMLGKIEGRRRRGRQRMRQLDGITISSQLLIKITADGDCSHEIKTLTPWKESYDQPR